MSKIPLLPIGRTIIAEMKNSHNPKGYTLYLQANRKTILDFENSFYRWTQNVTNRLLETAVVYHWDLVTNTQGSPTFKSTVFPECGFCEDGLDDFNRIIAVTNVQVETITKLMLFESDYFNKTMNLLIYKWLIFFNTSELRTVLLTPIIINDKISKGKVFLKPTA